METDSAPTGPPRPRRRRRRWLWVVGAGVGVVVGIVLANTPVVTDPGVQAGAQFDRTSSALTVSGIPMAAHPIYIRVADAAGFQTDMVTLLLARQSGGGWSIVRRVPSTVTPSDAIDVLTIPSLAPGRYQATWVANNQTIGQTTFTVA